jgi:hypothetical protein
MSMLTFLIINWPERLCYVEELGGRNLIEIAALWSTPYTMKVLLKLADEFYGDTIKDFFEEPFRKKGGIARYVAQRVKNDDHCRKIVLLLNKYFKR